MSKQYYQGDLLFEKVEGAEAREMIRHFRGRLGRGKIVLARGEKNGHEHSVDASRAIVIANDDDNYLVVPRSAEVVHLDGAGMPTGDHGTLALDNGVYRIVQQRTLGGGSFQRNRAVND